MNIVKLPDSDNTIVREHIVSLSTAENGRTVITLSDGSTIETSMTHEDIVGPQMLTEDN